MKYLLLNILRFLFKIDVRRILRQNEILKTENKKLSEKLENLLTSKKVVEKEKALDIYRKFDGRLVSDDMTWKEMNLQDFETLKDISDYREKFEKALQLLGWN